MQKQLDRRDHGQFRKPVRAQASGFALVNQRGPADFAGP
jgi:hypothetical protein